jgi:hypothetical protein
MHHVRRSIRRRDTDESRWRRVTTIRTDEVPWNPLVKIRTPMSHDAPIGPKDERFWRRLDVLLVTVTLAVVGVWLAATLL